MTSISRLLLSVGIIGSFAGPAFAHSQLHAAHRHPAVRHVGLTHDVGAAATPFAIEKPGVAVKPAGDRAAMPAAKAN